MTHEQRLAAAHAFRTNVLEERSRLRKSLLERESLIARLQQERDEASALVDRWSALAEMTMWAELDSGKTIHTGDRVRYLLRTYECVKDHTKALLRSPLNGEYWKEVADHE